MLNQDVGIIAGEIWHLLEEKGELTLSQVESEVKGSEFFVHAAIGWLAREGKLYLNKKDRTIILALKDMPSNYFA